MSFLLLNLLLAFTWAAVTASFTLSGLAIGFVLGYVALWFTQPIFGQGPSPYFTRVTAAIRLLVYFFYELIKSSIDVAWDVLTPRSYAKPSMIEMPLDAKSDLEILLVTNLISLTPGTLSVDVSEDRSTLIVHAMFAENPEELVADLKNGMERMVMEAVG
ncbi:MAG: Na+/H+ antiporter subunit E [Pseudomonadota bacterium]